MTKAVIFDCDGVLIDSEIIAVEVEMALLAGHGLGYETAEFKTRFMGMSDAAFYAALAADSRERLNRDLPADFGIDPLRKAGAGRQQRQHGHRQHS